TALAGRYFVVASNLFGRATSSVATVTITVPPELIAGLTNQVVDAGADVILVVTPQGSAPLAFTWDHNGAPIAGANGPTLLLPRVQLNQAGAYGVTVANAFGSLHTSMGLAVRGLEGTVVAWGDDIGRQTDVPAGLTGVIDIAGGEFHSLALR